MRKLQHPSGAFQATREGSECDMRFLYCACAISAALQDWSGVNCDSAVCYIMSCVTYEGGISLIPGKKYISTFKNIVMCNYIIEMFHLYAFRIRGSWGIYLLCGSSIVIDGST